MPGITKCVSTGLKAGPVSLIWNVRMASITPQQLTTICKKCSKTLYNKEIALLKGKLGAIKQGSSISIAVSQRTDTSSREKATIRLLSHHAAVHRHRGLLTELRATLQVPAEPVDVPHVSSAAQDLKVEGRTYAIGATDGSQLHNHAVELHPGWSYKEIAPDIAGQFDVSDKPYHIPDDIFNRKQSNNLMEHANKGTLTPELYSRSRTAHDGITYLSGTTTFGNKQKYCRSMLFDTGCGFNIASSWYLRDMLGGK